MMMTLMVTMMIATMIMLMMTGVDGNGEGIAAMKEAEVCGGTDVDDGDDDSNADDDDDRCK